MPRRFVDLPSPVPSCYLRQSQHMFQETDWSGRLLPTLPNIPGLNCMTSRTLTQPVNLAWITQD